MIQCIYNYINIHVYINMGFDIAHLQTLFALAIYIYMSMTWLSTCLQSLTWQ